jgi:repressor LexA
VRGPGEETAESGPDVAPDAGPDPVELTDATARPRELVGRLASRRVALGLSQAQVAELMQTSQSAIARLESGQRDAQLSTLARYAEALGLSLDFTEDTRTRTGDSSDDTGDGIRPRGRPGRKPKRASPTPMVAADARGKPSVDQVLTWRQRKVLQLIRDSIEERGHPPSMREIGEAAGLTSTSSVSYQLSVLERKGFLHRDVSGPRTVNVQLPDHWGAPAEPDWKEEETSGVSGANIVLHEAVFVPLVGQVEAGEPILAQRNVKDAFALPRMLVGQGPLFVLQVTGDSMINAGITDGDWVVVRQQADARDGDLVAVNIDGVTVVRTYKWGDGQVWLIPAHPEDTPTLCDKASILGRVVTVIRKV